MSKPSELANAERALKKAQDDLKKANEAYLKAGGEGHAPQTFADKLLDAQTALIIAQSHLEELAKAKPAVSSSVSSSISQPQKKPGQEPKIGTTENDLLVQRAQVALINAKEAYIRMGGEGHAPPDVTQQFEQAQIDLAMAESANLQKPIAKASDATLQPTQGTKPVLRQYEAKQGPDEKFQMEFKTLNERRKVLQRKIYSKEISMKSPEYRAGLEAIFNQQKLLLQNYIQSNPPITLSIVCRMQDGDEMLPMVVVSPKNKTDAAINSAKFLGDLLSLSDIEVARYEDPPESQLLFITGSQLLFIKRYETIEQAKISQDTHQGYDLKDLFQAFPMLREILDPKSVNMAIKELDQYLKDASNEARLIFGDSTRELQDTLRNLSNAPKITPGK